MARRRIRRRTRKILPPRVRPTGKSQIVRDLSKFRMMRAQHRLGIKRFGGISVIPSQTPITPSSIRRTMNRGRY